MYELKFGNVTHCQYAATKHRHDLFASEGTIRDCSLLNLVMQGVRLVLEVFDYFVLLGTNVGLGKDFVVESVEVKLMSEGQTAFVIFYIFL